MRSAYEKVLLFYIASAIFGAVTMLALGHAMSSGNQYLGYPGDYKEGSTVCFKTSFSFLVQSGIACLTFIVMKAKSIREQFSRTETSHGTVRRFENHPKGFLFMGLGIFSGSAMRILSHTAMAYGDLQVEGLVVMWGLTCTLLAFTTILTFYSLSDLVPSENAITQTLVIRGLFGALALYLLQTANKLLPAGAVSAVFYTNPCFTLLIAYVLLREKTTFSEVTGAIISLFGVIFIAQPWNTEYEDYAGFAYVCGAAITAACAYTALRHALRQGAHHMSAVLSFSTFVLILGVTMKGIDALLITSGYSLILGFLASIAGFSSNACISLGFKYLRAGTGAIFRKTEVFVVYVLSAILLNENATPVELIGAALIVSGTSLVALSGLRKR